MVYIFLYKKMLVATENIVQNFKRTDIRFFFSHCGIDNNVILNYATMYV